jgi:malate synthase
MTQFVERHGLQVAVVLDSFINDEALPGTGLAEDHFWKGFSALIHDLMPENAALLKTRDDIQVKIDEWHRANHGASIETQEAFLKSIGYLVPKGPDFKIETSNVDAEIATTAGSQLVVPVMNARYALNAANARWGSLYDALYGTDAGNSTCHSRRKSIRRRIISERCSCVCGLSRVQGKSPCHPAAPSRPAR